MEGTLGQDPEHDACSRAAQAACTVIGVQFTSQPPSTCTSHTPCASTSMLPQASMPACAGAALSSGSANRAAPKIPKEKDLLIDCLIGLRIFSDSRAVQCPSQVEQDASRVPAL